MKQQLTEWEKVFANDMTDKELISNKLIKKWAKEMNRHFSKEDADGQQAHEKMLNIDNHQGNANQNHNEILPHTCQNGYHEKNHK